MWLSGGAGTADGMNTPPVKQPSRQQNTQRLNKHNTSAIRHPRATNAPARHSSQAQFPPPTKDPSNKNITANKQPGTRHISTTSRVHNYSRRILPRKTSPEESRGSDNHRRSGTLHSSDIAVPTSSPNARAAVSKSAFPSAPVVPCIGC